MMTEPSNFRRLRIAKLIQNALSNLLISGKFNDERLSQVSITDVIVSADLKNAKVYMLPLTGGKEKGEELLKVLQNATGFFRHHLAEVLDLKATPTLNFYIDQSQIDARKIDEILKK